MPWYRRPTGELVHAVGGRAVALEARGCVVVEDTVAEAEVADLTPVKRAPKPLVVVKHRAEAKLTPREKGRVKKAVADEAPPAARRMEWDK